MNFKFKPGDIVKHFSRDIFILILGVNDNYKSEPWDEEYLKNAPVYWDRVLVTDVDERSFPFGSNTLVICSPAKYIDENFYKYLPHRK